MAKHLRDTVTASGLERAFACPGSVRLSQGIEREKSSYALEGNFAHAFGEEMIRYALKTREKIKGIRQRFKPGHIIKLRDGETTAASQEMADIVSFYVEHVLSHGGVVEVEVNVKHDDHVRNAYADAVVDCGKKLVVIDLKYGFTPVHLVSSDGVVNQQLMYYAAGALAQKEWKHKTAVLEIVQPRCLEVERVQSVEIKTHIIKDWAEVALFEALHAVDDPNASLATGDHCRFCPALAACPAVHAQTQELAKVDFADARAAEPKVPDRPVDLARVLRVAPIIEAWLKACEARALELMTQGQQIDGFKLVKKRANREWPTDNENELARLLKKAGMKEHRDIMCERKLLGPAGLEKLIGKEIVNKVAAKPDAGLTIAAESDRREAVSPGGDFEELM